MLAQIQTAFEGRRRSEARLRQFVADASHELRTPLATIAGYSELARRHPDDEIALRTALTKVDEESSRMTSLVEDLLLLARLDSGRPLAQEPVDLVRLLVEAVSDAQVLAPEHRWRLDVPETPVVVTVLRMLSTSSMMKSPRNVVSLAIVASLKPLMTGGSGWLADWRSSVLKRPSLGLA